MSTLKKKKADEVAARLAKLYPGAVCSLEYGGDPWRLLVMGRLSAQCTDERVNIVCKQLFREYPDAASMAAAPLQEIERLIRSCGLFRTKAASIKEASQQLIDKYGGVVPDNMEELLSLPGVGRKIANLLLGDIYGKGGIVADTHCIRICARLGFYPEKTKNPLKTEQIMGALINAEEQCAFCHRIVLFGREFCSARSPRCSDCALFDICSYNKQKRKAGKING